MNKHFPHSIIQTGLLCLCSLPATAAQMNHTAPPLPPLPPAAPAGNHSAAQTSAPAVPAAAPQQKSTKHNFSEGIPNPLNIADKQRKGYQNPYPKGSYEHFVASRSYPKTLEVYSNDRVLAQICSGNNKIIICIPQQRARLYVNGHVGLDWPVSTGRDGHETPTGVFRIQEKEKQHYSNRYGKFVNSRGRTISSSADLSKGDPPRGAQFKPAGMPNWHRLTNDGVGIHGGRVVAGQRLSHGCIRSPYEVAAKLFSYSSVGMPVYISRAVEDYYRGGNVKPIDVKYRPKAGNDYSDEKPVRKKP